MKRIAVVLAGLVAASPLAAAAPAAPAKPAAPAAAAPAAKGIVVERIVAIVNDGVVLLSEVETVLEDMLRAQPPQAGTDVERWKQQRRREILDTLVAEKLLEQEVRKLRVEVTDAEVARVVEATKQEHGLDDARLQAALAQQGLTVEEYKEGLKKQLTKMKIVQLKVKSRVTVSDQDVKTIANQQRQQRSGAVKVRARHILFVVPPGQSGDAERAKAERALQRLAAGEDFAKLAGELSDDAASARRGGDLGVFGRGEMVPEFEAAVFAAPTGEVTGPLRTPFGWHLIVVDERIQAGGPGGKPGADLEGLRQELYEAEVEQQFLRYIEELKRDAYIETRI